jgi:hypothetical protein
VRLGDLEEDNDETQLVRKITEWVFEVDNLTKEDRRAAAAHEREMKEQVEIMKRRAAKSRRSRRGA